MSKYLIDTNICIYYMKGNPGLLKKFEEVKISNCFISEITVAELKFGVENSKYKTKNKENMLNLISSMQILPIYASLDIYAKEKARLRNSGMIIDDFDLLIGATAVANKLILVTNNLSHFERIKGIKLENWI
ncbi:MAG: type II toxin-antitoxin system VapC family toxin [bacterium]